VTCECKCKTTVTTDYRVDEISVDTEKCRYLTQTSWACINHRPYFRHLTNDLFKIDFRLMEHICKTSFLGFRTHSWSRLFLFVKYWLIYNIYITYKYIYVRKACEDTIGQYQTILWGLSGRISDKYHYLPTNKEHVLPSLDWGCVGITPVLKQRVALPSLCVVSLFHTNICTECSGWRRRKTLAGWDSAAAQRLWQGLILPIEPKGLSRMLGCGLQQKLCSV